MSTEPTKKCPLCESPMVLREGRRGPFWGCTKYPECNGTLPEKRTRLKQITADIRSHAHSCLDAALDFIVQCGNNATKAQEWLDFARGIALDEEAEAEPEKPKPKLPF